jgi:hypothetical protein
LRSRTSFEDHCENALKELLRRKQKGEKIERPREPARTNVVNLMEALRQSVKAAGGKQSSATQAQSKKGKKRSVPQLTATENCFDGFRSATSHHSVPSSGGATVGADWTAGPPNCCTLDDVASCAAAGDATKSNP